MIICGLHEAQIQDQAHTLDPNHQKPNEGHRRKREIDIT